MLARVTRILALTTGMLAPMAPAAQAAQWATVVGETVYTPTSSVLALPTAYVPTSYSYLPTSYSYTPTVYTSTSWLSPTYYVEPTAYVVRRPARYYVPRRYVRPYVATSRVYSYDLTPTAYYVPATTTLDLPLVRTSAEVCCEPEPVCATETAAPPVDNAAKSASNNDPEPAYNDPSKTVKSTPRNGGTNADRTGSTGANPSKPAAGTNTGGAAAADPSPPDRPAPDGGAGDAAKDLEIPDNPPGKPGDLDRRNSLRPVLNTARSTLRGKLLSAVDGKPEKGVKITAIDARGRFRDKVATTDDTGRFAIVLPEGDWMVVVPTADNKSTTEQAVTVSGGLITDAQDREVSNLIVNR